jgi:high-affinity nickel-transport protein
LHGPFFDFITRLNFGMLGYVIVALFLLAWALSVAFWKFGGIEQRYSLGLHAHMHVHADGCKHSHDHLHSHRK